MWEREGRQEGGILNDQGVEATTTTTEIAAITIIVSQIPR